MRRESIGESRVWFPFYSVSLMYVAELLPVIFPRDGSLFRMEGVSLRAHGMMKRIPCHKWPKNNFEIGRHSVTHSVAQIFKNYAAKMGTSLFSPR